MTKHLNLQVYKSASKRKAHILKNHPGAELPPSIRKLRPAGPGEPDPMLSTHTQLTGTIATPPVCCPHCSKQYSSKVLGSALNASESRSLLKESPKRRRQLASAGLMGAVRGVFLVQMAKELLPENRNCKSSMGRGYVEFPQS